MAKLQKKGTPNVPRARERTAANGQPANPYPLAGPTPAVQALVSKKGDGVGLPPSVAERMAEAAALVSSPTPRTLMNALSAEVAL